MTNIAIFVSGKGSNAQKIIEYFEGNQNISIALIISSNVHTAVAAFAEKRNIPVKFITSGDLSNEALFMNTLKDHGIDFIVLAGFLKLIPDYLVAAYPDKIVNVHPALLPKFGGKGMYGMNVHKAVIAAKEAESGITIHYVNENYDEGKIIFQGKCEIGPQDTPETLALEIQKLEHQFYPEVIHRLLS